MRIVILIDINLIYMAPIITKDVITNWITLLISSSGSEQSRSGISDREIMDVIAKSAIQV